MARRPPASSPSETATPQVKTFSFMIILKRSTHEQLLQHYSTTPFKPFWHDHHSAGAGRADRILHEALAVGPDPLHLSLVFNLSHTTASRYARLVEQFLVSGCPWHARSTWKTLSPRSVKWPGWLHR